MTHAPIVDRATVAPVVIDVEGLGKTFRIPDRRVDSLKERLTRPGQRVTHRELHALEDVSFSVHRGEFFGIVGRNGSGKSTLLKILASIYAADRGRVRTMGIVAPFIELGVGFNPDLPARDNVVLNGILMGLTRREARRRFDAVLEFAELQDFADLRVKNYSSGMMVRLAFSIMVQAEADVMLIDEVLAVGDAAFARKCMEVFEDNRRRGKTIVLVTHDMATVRSLCDRALLLHDGRADAQGDPEDVAMRYFRLNFAKTVDADDPLFADAIGRTAIPDVNADVVSAVLRDPRGTAVERVEHGATIALDARLRARRDLRGARFVLQVRTADDVVVATFEQALGDHADAGAVLELRARLANPLLAGEHRLDCWVRRDLDDGSVAVQGLRLLEFTVEGRQSARGVIALDGDLQVAVEGPTP